MMRRFLLFFVYVFVTAEAAKKCSHFIPFSKLGNVRNIVTSKSMLDHCIVCEDEDCSTVRVGANYNAEILPRSETDNLGLRSYVFPADSSVALALAPVALASGILGLSLVASGVSVGLPSLKLPVGQLPSLQLPSSSNSLQASGVSTGLANLLGTDDSLPPPPPNHIPVIVPAIISGNKKVAALQIPNGQLKLIDKLAGNAELLFLSLPLMRQKLLAQYPQIPQSLDIASNDLKLGSLRAVRHQQKTVKRAPKQLSGHEMIYQQQQQQNLQPQQQQHLQLQQQQHLQPLQHQHLKLQHHLQLQQQQHLQPHQQQNIQPQQQQHLQPHQQQHLQLQQQQHLQPLQQQINYQQQQQQQSFPQQDLQFETLDLYEPDSEQNVLPNQYFSQQNKFQILKPKQQNSKQLYHHQQTPPLLQFLTPEEIQFIDLPLESPQFYQSPDHLQSPKLIHHISQKPMELDSHSIPWAPNKWNFKQEIQGQLINEQGMQNQQEIQDQASGQREIQNQLLNEQGMQDQKINQQGIQDQASRQREIQHQKYQQKLQQIKDQLSHLKKIYGQQAQDQKSSKQEYRSPVHKTRNQSFSQLNLRGNRSQKKQTQGDHSPKTEGQKSRQERLRALPSPRNKVQSKTYPADLVKKALIIQRKIKGDNK